MDGSLSPTLLAGVLAAIIFSSSHVPMLVRAYTTKDLRSYSFAQFVLSNMGNVVYWIYVATLPIGPIWLLHSFYTVANALMLVWWLRYRVRQAPPAGPAGPGASNGLGRRRRERQP